MLWIPATVILILCITNFKTISNWILTRAFDHYYDYLGTESALPSNGKYKCRELDMDIIFDDGDICVIYRGEENDQVFLDYSGEIVVESTQIMNGTVVTTEIKMTAFYHWNQEKDVIQLKFTKADELISKDTQYFFYNTENG